MLLYRFLSILFSPLLIAYLLWQAITKKESRYFWQHIGFNYQALPENSLWFHCASVGEVITLLPLLRHLHQQKPELNFTITTNTVTGSKIVQQQRLDYLHHSYLPFDWTFSIKRFLKATNPAALFVMETEIWPNLFSVCHKNKIAIHIINARLSSKTTNANNWIKNLLKLSLLNVSAIYARTATDAEAYKQLGAAENILQVSGNLKLSTVISDQQLNTGNKNNREYILLASSHNDEERQIYKQWISTNRKELLIIAPRHPERSAAIIKQLDCKAIAIRSRGQPITADTKIFLLDTIGELKDYFANARVVIMGGSFVPIGGHNILEPASFNCPVITGPYMENFKEELQLMLDKKAIIQVQNYDELGHKLAELLVDKTLREKLQNNTRDLVHNAEKTLDDYSELILKHISDV